MIPKSFEDAFAQVKGLAGRFGENEAAYLSPKYLEQEVRDQFLNPFFEALGWDVYHKEHPNPYEREVKIEKSVMVGDRGKRADYAFYTRPNFLQARFMAEAKKPARQLENAYDCFQAMRYGWNSNTQLAVLTDFEQFLILDSRYKPTVEKAANGIIEKFHYTQFTDEESFRKIYYLFSREAVGDGSLEKFVQTLKKAKTAKAAKVAPAVQIQPVGDTFLTELDVHRDELARGFKRNNAELDGDELTEITQRTLDRLVFIRFLEDKLVEPSEIIDRLGMKSGSKWRDFANEVPRLNSVYNGIIFKPHAILDSPDFQPDEKAFSDTLAWLSHKNSPYDFNTIPIHILGSIYERFLGKTIVVTDKRATLEEKPEVRKAGGVYYTPVYIVRYIVENTIGKLLKSSPPNEGGVATASVDGVVLSSEQSSVDANAENHPPATAVPLLRKEGSRKLTPADIAKMRFADIACGSGSFLLGIFDYLIKYHVEWYSANKTRREEAIKKGLCRETSDGTLQLTIAHKRDVLLNNIYGVDLDAQAVEVAQLSLYLKLLEEETTATAQQYLAGFREQLLPSLNNNIVHGNSLIDFDITDGQLFDSKDLKKLNPMSFQSTFPEVFANGGFDAIVGNPPYRMLQPHNTERNVIEYLKRNYVAAEFKIELFHLFLQRGVSVLKPNGKLGFIVPTTVLNNVYAESLRSWIMAKSSIDIIAVARGRVFADADVHTSVLTFSRDEDVKNRKANQIAVTTTLDADFAADSQYEAMANQLLFPQLLGKVWNVLINSSNAELITRLMMDFVPLGDVSTINRGLITGDRKKYFSDVQTHPSHVPIIAGSDVNRYFVIPPTEFVLFERPKTSGGCWDREVHFAPHKVVVRQIGEKPTAGYVDEPIAVTGNIFTVRGKIEIDERYLLGLINSRLAEFYWRTMFADFKASFPQVTIFSLSQLPIRTIDFNNPAEKAMHDRMVELVEKMMDGKKKLAEARTDSDRALWTRLAQSLDTQIDDLVYQLYDITPDERKIIEGN